MTSAGRWTGARERVSPYPRLVPASLLPPEDPSTAPRRTVRDWVVDLVLFLASAALGLALSVAATNRSTVDVGRWLKITDLGLGLLACLALWTRRRWPAGVGVFASLLSAVSAAAGPAAVVAVFGTAVHRRTGVALPVAVVSLAAGLVFQFARHQDTSLLVAVILNVGATGVVVAWGMFVRARRQLVWTLRERAERAEAEQHLLADQARQAERTRIAREMHDVLAHRISMIALHAGGLEMRPDLPVNDVRATAELLRNTSRVALEELRGVIGVLRTEDSTADAPAPPQPTLTDIPTLVEDTRRAGAHIDFTMDVPEGMDVPAALGRDAYRIVQEALTNIAKHARGTATVVRVSGERGTGLHVDVRNKLPVGPPATSTLPGSGSGLVGLRERVTLAGGTLAHGPNDAGEFAVDAVLAWS